MKVCVCDVDGVVRIFDRNSIRTDRCEFQLDKIKLIDSFCESTGAKIVISSDWRRNDNKQELEELLWPASRHFHEDWMTPIKGTRWGEIQSWLSEHPEVGANYVIFDDIEFHFTGCPEEMRERLIICDPKDGVGINEIWEAYDLFRVEVAQ